MRKVKKVISGVLVSMVLVIVGCKKSHCYQCYAFQDSFRAIRGTDTLYITANQRLAFQDSINVFLGEGYRVDTVFNEGYTKDPIGGGLTCGQGVTPGLITEFDSCVYVGAK